MDLEAVRDAILDGRDKQLRSLLQTATPEAVSAPIDEEGTTLLHLAANTENPRVLSLLLDLGVAVNSQNGDGFTPLHVATMWGREESVRLLMERGADPVISDDENMTPLDYSESEGHYECVNIIRNWSSPSKENSNNSANVTYIKTQPHNFSYPSSPTPPPTSDYSGTTVDESMAEAFVSMYLNMTQVAQDLTEVTQMSGLIDSPSLLDILTTHPVTPPHHTSHPHCITPPHHISPPHPITHVTPPPHISPSPDSGHVETDWQSGQGHKATDRATCVRRLDLTYCKNKMSVAGRGKMEKGQTGKLTGTQCDERVDTESRNDKELVESAAPSCEGETPKLRAQPSLTERLRLTPAVRSDYHSVTSATVTAPKTQTISSREKLTPVKQSHTAAATGAIQHQVPCEMNRLKDRKYTYQMQSHPSSVQDTDSRSSLPAKEHTNTDTDSVNSTLLADSSFAADITTRIPRHLHSLTNEELRQRLLARGEHPGPITETTRPAYLVYLAKLDAGIQPSGNTGYEGYKYELALVLNGTSPIPDFSSLEYQVFRQYRVSSLPGSPLRTLPSITAPSFPLPRSLVTSLQTSPRSKRDWSTKTHFNYLLLDPSQLHQLDPGGRDSVEQFRVFVEGVFYVGKGKNARSLQHLKEARDKMHGPKSKLTAKLSRILSVWSSGKGVVSLHIFHNTTAEEAFSREACMIDAIGLDMLTNVQKGHTYGEVSRWGAGKRRQFGVFLLHKAYLCYLLDPPQPVGQDDL